MYTLQLIYLVSSKDTIRENDTCIKKTTQTWSIKRLLTLIMANGLSLIRQKLLSSLRLASLTGKVPMSAIFMSAVSGRWYSSLSLHALVPYASLDERRRPDSHDTRCWTVRRSNDVIALCGAWNRRTRFLLAAQPCRNKVLLSAE